MFVEHLAHGYHESVNSPIFSTAIGLMLRGLEDVAAGSGEQDRSQENGKGNREPSNVSEEKEASWLDSVFRKTKEWFEAEPDLDFEQKK